MPSRTARAACVAAIAIVACGTVQVVQVHAAEGGFLEMLFGVRPAPAPQAQAPAALSAPAYSGRPRHLGYGRHKLKTRYAALPVRIHVSERQTPLDMSAGPAAALLRDETLRPGDIVVFKTGAQVFSGRTGRRHTMDDFEPVRRSAKVDQKTRKLLAAMTQPAGALPAGEARRMVARARKAAPAPTEIAKSAEIRVISPWRTTP